MIAILRCVEDVMLLVASGEFQGRGMSAGSVSHGLAAMTTRMKRDKPASEVLSGPIQLITQSAPAAMEDHPSVGIRNPVGLKP